MAAEEATAPDAGETAPAMGGAVCAGGSSETVACVAAEEATAPDAGETAAAMGGAVCAGGSSEIVAVVPGGGAA